MDAALRALAGSPSFRSGMAWGLAATLAIALAWSACNRASRLRQEPLPFAGLALVAVTCTVLQLENRLDGRLVLGFILVAVGAAAGERLAETALARPGLVLPGAVTIATQPAVPDATWVRVTVVVAVVLGGSLLDSFDKRWGTVGLTPPLVAVTAMGVYSTVPDTERALVLLGVALALAASGWPLRVARFGTAGSFAAGAMIVWVAAADGRGRQGAIVGGIACLGLLALDPVQRRVNRGGGIIDLIATGRTWVRVPAVAVMHSVLVLIASRVAGLRRGAAASAVIVGFTAAAVLTASWLWGRRTRRADPVTTTWPCATRWHRPLRERSAPERPRV